MMLIPVLNDFIQDNSEKYSIIFQRFVDRIQQPFYMVNYIVDIIFLVVLERGSHLFPFRTQKLSLSSPMVLHG